MTTKVQVIRIYKNSNTFSGYVPPHNPTATLTKEEPPVYAISKPRRIVIGHGRKREVWWEVLLSNGRVNLSERLASAEQFFREHRRQS